MEALVISNHQFLEMINHVQKNLPEEACGMLAGKKSLVKKVIPVTNNAHSPVRFYMDPVELLHALEWIEESGYDLIGIFHSHPNGPPVPSETDVKEFLYPGAATVILSPSDTGWNMRGFDIQNKTCKEIELIINRNAA